MEWWKSHYIEFEDEAYSLYSSTNQKLIQINLDIVTLR